MEAKLINQEGRDRRDNIRINGIPEEAEGDNISSFLINLLRDSLDLPLDMELKVKRAHRALVPKPTNSQVKPHSIIAKLASFRVKEEVICKAWQKKRGILQEHPLLCGPRLPTYSPQEAC